MPGSSEIREAAADKAILAFDGRVLEVFNYKTESSHRFHVARMSVSLRKGLGKMILKLKHEVGGAGVYLDVKSAQQPAVEELVAALEEAIAQASLEYGPPR